MDSILLWMVYEKSFQDHCVCSVYFATLKSECTVLLNQKLFIVCAKCIRRCVMGCGWSAFSDQEFSVFFKTAMGRTNAYLFPYRAQTSNISLSSSEFKPHTTSKNNMIQNHFCIEIVVRFWLASVLFCLNDSFSKNA